MVVQVWRMIHRVKLAPRSVTLRLRLRRCALCYRSWTQCATVIQDIFKDIFVFPRTHRLLPCPRLTRVVLTVRVFHQSMPCLHLRLRIHQHIVFKRGRMKAEVLVLLV